MVRHSRWIWVFVGLCACEPPYREALRAGDESLAADPAAAASHYQRAVDLGATGQGHVKLGELAERLQQWETAAHHYGQAQLTMPREPYLAHAQVRALLELGQRQQAFEVLRTVSVRIPEDVFCRLMMAALAEAPEQVAQAAEAFRTVAPGSLEQEVVEIALASRQGGLKVNVASTQQPLTLSAVPLFRLATVLEGTGHPALSARLLEAGTEKFPAEQLLWYPLLRAQVASRDYRGAQTTFEKLPSDLRFSPEVLMLHAQAQLGLGDRATAISAIRRAIRALPDNAVERRTNAQLLLGQALLEADEKQAAAETFSAVLVAAPNHIKALLGKASAELKSGSKEAIRTTTQVVALAPLDDAGRKLHVAALLAAGDWGAAKASADQYVAQAPERPEAWGLRAKVLAETAKSLPRVDTQRMGILGAARDDIRQALTRASQEPALLDAWLAIEEEMVGYPKSIEQLRPWLKEQKRWAPYVQVASYCNTKSDPKMATGLFREASELAPGEPSVWRVLAAHLETLASYPQALDAQARLLTLAPTDESALRDSARLHRKLGNTDAAIATYRRWLSLNPRAVLALNNLAAILGESSATLDEAVALAERAADRAPASPGVADTLGWLLFRRNRPGDRAKAIELLGRASRDLDNAVHHLHLAEALTANGDQEGAKVALEKALAHEAFDGVERARALRAHLGQ